MPQQDLFAQTSINNHDTFIRVPEICQLIGVKKGTLYKLIKAGELKPIKLIGTTVFSKQQVIEWMKSKLV